jgi:hypothetical protein
LSNARGLADPEGSNAHTTTTGVARYRARVRGIAL